jgi:hypothetical protein
VANLTGHAAVAAVERILAARAADPAAVREARREERERIVGELLALVTRWERPLTGMRQRANTGGDFAEIRSEEAARRSSASDLRAVIARIGGPS